jgi:hypothetical protein
MGCTNPTAGFKHPPEMGPATNIIPVKDRPTVKACKNPSLDFVKYLRHPISSTKPQVQITSVKNTCHIFPSWRHVVPPAVGQRIVITSVPNLAKFYSTKHMLTISTPTIAPRT